MKSNPLVSVVVPVYGVEKYIKRCAVSLFSQTIADSCEFIFVDDCSPDNSIEILKAVIKLYPSLDIKIIVHEINKGLACARNTGFKHVTGQYFINVDSDDWVENNYLEILVQEALCKDADITGCNLIYEFSNRSENIKNMLPDNSETAIRNLLQGKISGWLPLKLFKTNLFKDNNLFWVEGLNMCEDLLITLKAFYYAKKIAYIDMQLYHYNKENETSLSTFLNESKICQLLNIVEEVDKSLRSWNQFDFYLKDFRTFKAHTKIWILTCSDFPNNYFMLYDEDCLYKNSMDSFYIRIFLWFCTKHFYIIAKIILYTKKLLARKH